MVILRGTPRGFRFRRPWPDLDRLRGQIEDLFQYLAGAAEGLRSEHAGVYPLVNLEEDAEKLYLSAEMPGVAPEEVELSVESESLTLRGERKIPETGEKVNYHRREREAGLFRRVITLPVKIEAEKVQAVVKDGVLRVTLPKAAEARPRQIAVKGA